MGLVSIALAPYSTQGPANEARKVIEEAIPRWEHLDP